MVAKSSSSAIENSALDSMVAIVSGCKFCIADTASLDIVESYNKAYHLCAISLSVNLQLNLTPLCTIVKLFVYRIKQNKICINYFKIQNNNLFIYILFYLTCKTLWISIKSSVGFQRPKSLFKFFCFLDLFLLDDDGTVEVDGALAKALNVLGFVDILIDATLRGCVVEVDGVVFEITVSGILWTGDITLSISVKKTILSGLPCFI